MENDIIIKLKELEKESVLRGIPIIGSEKGTWLYNKIKETKPLKILEIGTANGYSGILLGYEGAELVTIELDKNIAREAEKNFKKFGINAKIIIGDAVEEVKKISKNKREFYDLIFIDFYKRGYIKILEECIKLVKKNGYIIADNITFEGCQDYKEAVLKDIRLETEIIEIRDGLSWSKKLI